MDNMHESIYQLFKKCFTNLPITEDIFYSLFDYEECDVITIYDQNKLIGYSAVCDNRIVLLCVDPENQRKGYGRKLVLESEKLVRRNGYDTVILGGTESKLFIGALTDEKEWSQKHNYFFEKCGYTASNGCLEMVMALKDFNIESLDIPLQLPNITFEYWNKSDKSELLSAVREVEEDWVKYFEHDIPIFAAMENGRCIGFTILSFDDITLCSNGINKVGMVGCVGVVPGRRKEGIGLAMVAHATNELKKNGCEESFIHYTYLDRWYGKLGYRSILWFWFGKKKL